jgi:hypothetical protein
VSVSAQDLAGQDVIWEPQPRQNVALRCPAFEVGYGGVKGCGKTDVMVMAMIHQLLYAQEQYEKTGRRQRGRFIIFRKNLKNLNDIIQRSHEIYPVLDPKSHWAKMEKRWEFQSGFVVDFAHLDGPDDHLGYNGQELTGFGIDQAEEIPEEVYNFLFMQVRTRDPGMKQLLKIMLTFNPGGRHADWIKRRFVIGCAPHNTIHKQTIQTSKGPVTTTAAFIPAKLSDNKYLYDDGLYEANLRRLPEHLRRMYLDGDWDVVVGAFFAHAWRRELTVIPSFPIPDTWQVKMGIDWGSSSPRAASGERATTTATSTSSTSCTAPASPAVPSARRCFASSSFRSGARPRNGPLTRSTRSSTARRAPRWVAMAAGRTLPRALRATDSACST